MPKDAPYFAENLAWACQFKPSVSQVCRDTSVNRQQFARYLRGSSRPSAHVLCKLADYFHIHPGDFDLPPARFQAQAHDWGTKTGDALLGFGRLLNDRLAETRRYSGFYQTFYTSPSWPGDVLCCLARIKEVNGIMEVKTLERIDDRAAEIRQTVKYRGFAAFTRERLMVTEATDARLAPPITTETILNPPDVYQRGYLRGLTFGLSWRAGNIAFSAPTIWQALGETPNLRKAMRACGRYPSQSGQLPFAVQSFFASAPAPYTLTPPRLDTAPL